MTSVLVFGGGNSWMNFILEGSNSMPLRLTIKPKSLPGFWRWQFSNGLSQSFEEISQIMHMVNLCSRFNDNIIDIYLNFFMHHVMEYGSYNSHVGCSRILQTKWHDSITICTLWDGENSFFLHLFHPWEFGDIRRNSPQKIESRVWHNYQPGCECWVMENCPLDLLCLDLCNKHKLWSFHLSLALAQH